MSSQKCSNWIESHIQWGYGVLHPGLRRPECEAFHSPPWSAKTKNL